MLLLSYEFILVDCEWNIWEIGECSKSCGGGTRTNTRTKKREESLGGTCIGDSSKKEDCNTDQCGNFLHTMSMNDLKRAVIFWFNRIYSIQIALHSLFFRRIHR